MSARGFLGAGDLYVSRYDPTLGDFTDYEGPFEATQFALQPNSELREMASRGKGTYGQVIESVPLPQPADLTVAFAEVNRESLAMALFGTSSVVNQGAGTLTAVAVDVKLGKWVPIGHENIAAAALTVKNEADTTTYVKGTDYEINYALGWIRALATGDLADGDTVHITGTYNAITGSLIRGATQSQVRARFKLDGINFADQLPCITTVHEAVLTPDSEFDFLGDQFATVNLTGRMKTPAGKSEPFTVELRNTASDS